MGSALALSFGLGSLLGIVAGARPGSATDRVLSIGSLALYAVPSFWLGLVLSVVFAVQLRWFPTSGIETIASGKEGLARAIDIAWHLVLPVGALGFIYLALFLRVMRAGMAETWRLDFVLSARAKGLARSRIVLRHVARNALLPLVTMLGLQAAAMLGGSVVIESVFAIPGFGRLAQEAVAGRDAPLLIGIIVTSAILVHRDQPSGRHRLRAARSARRRIGRRSMSVLLRGSCARPKASPVSLLLALPVLAALLGADFFFPG